MDFSSEFEVLRPYNNSEVEPAIARIIKHPYLKGVLTYLYPGQDINLVISKFKEIKTVDEFQAFFSHHAVRHVVETTSKGLTFSGLDELDKTTPYLFIANHHDIVLDSAIMQVLLLENGHRTSQITFGSNLMSDEIIIDLGKLNKMFTFYRGGSRMETYKNAVLHSAYIRNVITEKKESIWIAQRDGRTKNGDDRTQSGLIKMLLAGRKDYHAALKELNIVPVCITYEYVPCDILKARETYLAESGEYTKQAGEDFNSILTGITGYKGHVNMTFGKPINSIMNTIDPNIGLNDLADLVVESIDQEMHKNYKLWAGNYIALDILQENTTYLGSKYSETEKAEFLKYIDKKLSKIADNNLGIRTKLIEMYAKPVLNTL
ncbi:MAG: acyltransferase [Bacteroidota bacterium]